MHRTPVRKDQPPPADARESGLVRTEKVIPAMRQTPNLPEPGPNVATTQCSGRCGHCNVHPCQLHAPV